jgi:hypothetical protein
VDEIAPDARQFWQTCMPPAHLDFTGRLANLAVRKTLQNSWEKIMADAYIIDAVRTPRGIGKVGKGKLAEHHPQHLAATVLKATNSTPQTSTT